MSRKLRNDEYVDDNKFIRRIEAHDTSEKMTQEQYTKKLNENIMRLIE
jgi:hypothetical protein